jgi:hypothetical protein
LAAAAVSISLAAAWQTASAQEGRQIHSYTVTRTRTLLIDWRPEKTNYQRYTVSVSPLRLASNGLKFDFERELHRPGHWLGTSIALYLAPPRGNDWGGVWYWGDDDNNRAWFNSGFDYYHRMWGIGTSAMFKNTFSHRGWYFATGLTLEFFRVGVSTSDYTPYVEDGLTFYDYGTTIETNSYFKPTAQISIGKHMALSERCYFDLYTGLGISYAFTSDDERPYGNDDYHGWYSHRFTELGGFAYRGLTPLAGFRFGVLLWKGPM